MWARVLSPTGKDDEYAALGRMDVQDELAARLVCRELGATPFALTSSIQEGANQNPKP